MAKKSGYRTRVNVNTAVLVVLGLVFLGLGTLKSPFVNTGIGTWSEACDVELDNMTHLECRQLYEIQDTENLNNAYDNMFFFYSIGAVILVGAFVYRNHASTRELK